jgi:hypothetical protein
MPVLGYRAAANSGSSDRATRCGVPRTPNTTTKRPAHREEDGQFLRRLTCPLTQAQQRRTYWRVLQADSQQFAVQRRIRTPAQIFDLGR